MCEFDRKSFGGNTGIIIDFMKALLTGNLSSECWRPFALIGHLLGGFGNQKILHYFSLGHNITSDIFILLTVHISCRKLTKEKKGTFLKTKKIGM